MGAQAERLSAQLAAAQRGLEAARSAEGSARAQAAAEEKLRATAKAEGEAQAANLRSEQAAEVARLNAARKKAEVGPFSQHPVLLIVHAPDALHVGSASHQGHLRRSDACPAAGAALH
jgi:hypothetical protein